MEEVIFDIWDAGGKNVYLYTQIKSVYGMLKRDFNRFAPYTFMGKTVAWQFCVPKRLEKFLIGRIAEVLENEALLNNDLQS